jgi:hypothetical protein
MPFRQGIFLGGLDRRRNTRTIRQRPKRLSRQLKTLVLSLLSSRIDTRKLTLMRCG